MTGSTDTKGSSFTRPYFVVFRFMGYFRLNKYSVRSLPGMGVFSSMVKYLLKACLKPSSVYLSKMSLRVASRRFTYESLLGTNSMIVLGIDIIF